MRVGQGVYSNTQPKEKRKIPPSHSLGLVWFQTNKKKRRKSKKKGVRNLTTTCMFSIIHVFYIKQTC